MMLFVVAALFLVAGTAFAQESPRWSIDFMLDTGRTSSDYKTTPREGWQKDFQPPGRSMKVSTMNPTHSSTTIRLGLSFDILRTKSGWRLRVPISEQLAGWSGSYINSFGQEELAKATADWWDPVTVSDVVVKRYVPRIGLEVVRGRFMFGVSGQYFTVSERQFRGVDCSGCVNTSKVISSKDTTGISPRLEFYYGPFGGFYELPGDKISRFGFIFRVRTSDLIGM
ncbi:MAG: hypothetical protein NTX96_03050 [Candidatus Zambryskibacteria bacterium]|nr:hypothetical protein [Candidatus Zambryskibacteria bacterium]